MNHQQASNAYFRLAEPYIVQIEKRPTERSAKGLAVAFLDALTRTTGSYVKAGSRIERAREVDRLERKIWEMQQKRKCPIEPGEAIARDAIRQGNIDQETIDRLRGKRRPKIR